MPAKTEKQAKFMRACAHGWKPDKGECPPKDVAKKMMKKEAGFMSRVSRVVRGLRSGYINPGKDALSRGRVVGAGIGSVSGPVAGLGSKYFVEGGKVAPLSAEAYGLFSAGGAMAGAGVGEQVARSVSAIRGAGKAVKKQTTARKRLSEMKKTSSLDEYVLKVAGAKRAARVARSFYTKRAVGAESAGPFLALQTATRKVARRNARMSPVALQRSKVHGLVGDEGMKRLRELNAV